MVLERPSGEQQDHDVLRPHSGQDICSHSLLTIKMTDADGVTVEARWGESNPFNSIKYLKLVLILTRRPPGVSHGNGHYLVPLSIEPACHFMWKRS